MEPTSSSENLPVQIPVEAPQTTESPRTKEALAIAKNAADNGNLDLAREILYQVGLPPTEINSIIASQFQEATHASSEASNELRTALDKMINLRSIVESGDKRAMKELAASMYEAVNAQLIVSQRRTADMENIFRFLTKK